MQRNETNIIVIMLDLAKILDLKYEVTLASGSPRRKILLEQIGLKFNIIPADIDEDDISELDPAKFVMELANRKAQHVAKIQPGRIIIGSDTTVYLDEILLNKPANENEAFAMLTKLSGKTHQVYTGVSLVYNSESVKFHVKTDVTFRELGEREKYAYIATGSPMDKAGSYGIQDDYGSVFVENIVGCYYNIVGFPLSRFYQEIKVFNDKL